MSTFLIVVLILLALGLIVLLLHAKRIEVQF